jgi:tetratricopeptide (TPR) repeat protein
MGTDRDVLLTQVARALGLQERFDEAFALLDSIADSDPEVHVRVLLERGRLINSSGNPILAIPVFAEAFGPAWEANLEFLAIDAMHMEAIVAPAEMQDALNGQALGFAERARDPRARRWRGSVLNNMGWAAFERGDLDAALGRFKAALVARQEAGRKPEIDVARWCIGRTLRAMGRLQEALAIQQALAAEHAAAGTPDQFVQEELAELESAMKSDPRAGSPQNQE